MTSVPGVGFANEQESTRLDSSTIDSFMTKEIERLKIPGASLAIVKGDSVEYLQGYGVSNPDGTKFVYKIPCNPIFRGFMLRIKTNLKKSPFNTY